MSDQENELQKALGRRRQVVEEQGVKFVSSACNFNLPTADVSYQDHHPSQFTPRQMKDEKNAVRASLKSNSESCPALAQQESQRETEAAVLDNTVLESASVEVSAAQTTADDDASDANAQAQRTTNTSLEGTHVEDTATRPPRFGTSCDSPTDALRSRSESAASADEASRPAYHSVVISPSTARLHEGLEGAEELDEHLRMLLERHPSIAKDIALTAATSLKFEYLQAVQNGTPKEQLQEVWGRLGDEERANLLEAYTLSDGSQEDFFLKIVEEDRMQRFKLSRHGQASATDTCGSFTTQAATELPATFSAPGIHADVFSPDEEDAGRMTFSLAGNAREALTPSSRQASPESPQQMSSNRAPMVSKRAHLLHDSAEDALHRMDSIPPSDSSGGISGGGRSSPSRDYMRPTASSRVRTETKEMEREALANGTAGVGGTPPKDPFSAGLLDNPRSLDPASAHASRAFSTGAVEATQRPAPRRMLNTTPQPPAVSTDEHLWQAVVQGDITTLEGFAHRGVLVSGRLNDQNGHSIFWNAVAFQQPQVALWLLRRFPPESGALMGVDFNEVHERRGDSLLHICLHLQDYSVASELFRIIFSGGSGPSQEARHSLVNKNGQTFLNIAAARLNFWVLRFALTEDPSLEVFMQKQDSSGQTPVEVLRRKVLEATGPPPEQVWPDLPKEVKVPAWCGLSTSQPCIVSQEEDMPTFSDVVFEVQDHVEAAGGRLVKVAGHRVVISACSGVLQQKIKDAPNGVVHVDPTCCRSGEVLLATLRFCYTGEAALSFAEDGFLLWQMLCLCAQFGLPESLITYVRGALVRSLSDARHAAVGPVLFQAADHVGLTPAERCRVALAVTASPEAFLSGIEEGQRAQALLPVLSDLERYCQFAQAGMQSPLAQQSARMDMSMTQSYNM